MVVRTSLQKELTEILHIDFQVFDGPTVHSPLLLEKSGSVSTPFVVSSSTNQMLIRFTSSDDKTSRSSLGFEGVYSSV